MHLRVDRAGSSGGWGFLLTAWPQGRVLCRALLSGLVVYNSMDGSPPGSSVQGILRERILEWVAMPSSRDSS